MSESLRWKFSVGNSPSEPVRRKWSVRGRPSEMVRRDPSVGFGPSETCRRKPSFGNRPSETARRKPSVGNRPSETVRRQPPRREADRHVLRYVNLVTQYSLIAQRQRKSCVCFATRIFTSPSRKVYPHEQRGCRRSTLSSDYAFDVVARQGLRSLILAIASRQLHVAVFVAHRAP